MSGPRRERSHDMANRSSLLRLALYYAALLGLLVVLARAAPSVWSANSLERLRDLTAPDASAEPTVGLDLFTVFLSVVSSLLIMLPVAWTYILIKRRGDYDQSVVHTLLVLPVAVTGIVLIVQNSLALAFSLAGIVAAVRFRTTLKDVKDGVYVFLAIGVGLACGVQAIGVAAVVSVVFNAINLVLWAQDFGNIYADSARRTRALNLGETLAGPGSGKSAVSIGDRRLLEALTPRDLRDVAERIARMQGHLDAEASSQKEKRRYSVLIVQAKAVGITQRLVETLLERMCFRWRLAEIVPGDASTSVLEYLVRLREEYTPGELLDAIRADGGTHVLAAEIRSLSGLKTRRPDADDD